MWETRKQSIQALENNLNADAELVYDAFNLIDDMVQTFEKVSQDGPFPNVCGLVLLKARNLSHGMLSLSLDGLAQESGALLRPMIECLELLTYFSEDPNRVEEALEGRLPVAGRIAQKIKGRFHGLRNHLNEHTSHFSITPEAMLHLIDWKHGQWKICQPYNEKVLRKNLFDLMLFLVLLSFEAATCLKTIDKLSITAEERVYFLRQMVRSSHPSAKEL